MIDPRDVIAGASIAEHCARAERYFRSVDEPERLLAKPFISLNETPLLLYRLGLLLAGLKVGPTMRVLDFGAGTCWVSHILASLRCSVVCVDPSETALALGRRLFETRPIDGGLEPQFLPFDGETLPVAPGSIDRIVCFDALHHLPNPGRILSEFHRVLKDGGLAGFSEPGRQHSRSPVSQYEMQHYGVIESDVKLEDVKALADEAGFTGMTAAAEVGFETWLAFSEVEPVWTRQALPERWTTACLHSFHGRSTFVLQKGRYQADSRLGEGLAGEVHIDQHGIAVRADEPLIFDVAVRNTGAARWLAHNTQDIGVVKLGAKIRRQEAPDTAAAVHRTMLPADVGPGESLVLPVEICVSAPGEYTIALDLLDEQIVWFETLGLVPPEMRVSVLPVPEPSASVPAGTLRLPFRADLARMSGKRLAGFADPEPFGRWTTSETACVELAAPLPSAFGVTVSCLAFGPNVGRDLTLAAGGQTRLIRLTDAGLQTYAAMFSEVTSTTTLTFGIPAPTRPCDIGVGDDDRRLGVAVATLSVTAAG